MNEEIATNGSTQDDARRIARERERVRRLLARGAAGMTLIEIMVVVIIMGLIASAVGLAVFNQLKRAQIKTAQQEVVQVRSAIQIYQNDHPGVCPNVDQLVQDGELERNAATNDPWGQPFAISCDGETVSVISSGPDRRPGTADDIPQANGQTQTTVQN